jgi:hypothetical protein
LDQLYEFEFEKLHKDQLCENTKNNRSLKLILGTFTRDEIYDLKRQMNGEKYPNFQLIKLITQYTSIFSNP